MAKLKTISEWMQEQDISVAALVESSGLDQKIIEAIVAGRYTPSPQQRQRLAAVLGISTDQVGWAQTVQVDHMYGHGPQFGRTP